MELNEKIQVHDKLNPLLWNGLNLRPEVREKILEIVNEFVDYVEFPIDIVDVHLVGSNASFNYSEKSDLDVHIIANFETVTCDPELLKALYEAKKTSFNKKYEISIHSVPIELYVQDIKSSITSNGIYSIRDDEWVKKPIPLQDIKDPNVDVEVSKWSQKISEILNNGSEEDVTEAIDRLYLIRRNSIAVDGEMGKGNQIFRQIRSLGLLSQLKDRLDEIKTNNLSLENYTKGQFIHRADDLDEAYISSFTRIKAEELKELNPMEIRQVLQTAPANAQIVGATLNGRPVRIERTRTSGYDFGKFGITNGQFMPKQNDGHWEVNGYEKPINFIVDLILK